MKRSRLILILIGSGILQAHPQDSIVSIQDTAFLYALIEEGVDTSGDSLISYGEAETVTTLDISADVPWAEFCLHGSGNIQSIKGIEAFSNLDTFYCGGNKIYDTIDLSYNTSLKYLSCYQNSYTGHCVDSSGLRSLILSGCLALTYLDCENNDLTSLDVSKNIELENLICGGNQLTSLDVSKNAALITLACDDNYLTNLNLCSNGSLNLLDICDMASLDTVYLPFPTTNIDIHSARSPNVVFLDCATALTEYKKDEFHLYPNPIYDLLTIETDQPDKHFIQIISLKGQLLSSEVMRGTHHQLDLSLFQKGIYVITIRSKDFVTTRKIIKH